jgi:ParB-like chromosome segregation protein Spo0J
MKSEILPIEHVRLLPTVRLTPEDGFEELVKSIRANGQIKSILVQEWNGNGIYVVKDGWRRVKALQFLGIENVKVQIEPGSYPLYPDDCVGEPEEAE